MAELLVLSPFLGVFIVLVLLGLENKRFWNV